MTARRSLSRPARLCEGRVYERGMRIRTDGKFACREELVDDIADLLGENTRVGAVKASCEFTQVMLPALERAVEHPDMTEELTEILSTPAVEVKYYVETRSLRYPKRKTSEACLLEAILFGKLLIN